MENSTSTIEIPTLYESDEVLALDKPSGLLVHGDGKTDEATLADWLLARYPALAEVGESWRASKGEAIPRPGIVHRLDRETSGAILVAKTPEMFAHLKKQFQAHEIEKEYRAFVYGALKEDEGIIDRPIGKSAKNFRLRSAQRGARGALREAVTRWRVLERGADATYLAAFPTTGRTHQIRAHFKAIHHAVVCDALYAPKRQCLLGFSRLALHAHKISFTTRSGERVTVESPLPPDFIRALAFLRRKE